MLRREEVFAQDWTPEQLLHRDREQEAILRRLGQQSEHVLLHGPSGVGKTVLVERVRERLATEQGIETAYVESMDAPTATVLRRVLGEFSGPTPAANTAQEDLSLQLYERVDAPAAVVLDEGDDLHETTALERLFDVDPLAVVVVVHDADEFLAATEESLREQFRTATMEIQKFTTEELADILAARARRGLTQEAGDRELLRAVADQADGVARPAIQTLREAAAIGDERGATAIDQAWLPDAAERAQRRILTYNLESLPFHHRLLYELVRDAGEVSATELYQRYDAVAEEAYENVPTTPIGRRERRRKLSKVADYGLVERDGDGQVSYKVVDRDVGPPVGISLERWR